jgi:hypothetical protein
MTEEDRNAIAEIVAAAEQRIVQTTAAAVQAEIKAAEERIVTATIANLSDLRGELIRRLDTIERRTERMETNLHAVMLQTAGMSKSLSQAEALDTSFATQLAAQQKAIDELYARLRRIEGQRPQP